MTDNEILNDSELKDYSTSTYFVIKIPLYKHYNIERQYYIESEDEKLDGYTYDPSESILTYKVLKREIIEKNNKFKYKEKINIVERIRDKNLFFFI